MDEGTEDSTPCHWCRCTGRLPLTSGRGGGVGAGVGPWTFVDLSLRMAVVRGTEGHRLHLPPR